MLGAIIGDIVGSRFEFNPTNDYDFGLFTDDCGFTDDTVCTIAVADALMRDKDFGETIHEWCRRYPNPKGGYGGRFRSWVLCDNPKPYQSYGNGSAMRVSPVAWYDLFEYEVIHDAELSAKCSHDHPEGIKGAITVALAIHDCRGFFHGKLRKDVGRDNIMKGLRRALNYSGYDINIRKEDVLNKFDETCPGTVPVALWVVSNSESFEDAIRKAVSLGADADTLGAIVGSIAEVIWGIPTWMKEKAMSYLSQEMRTVVKDFRKLVHGKFPNPTAEIDNKNKHFAIMYWKLCLGNSSLSLEGKDPLPDKSTVATADSWKISPLPDESKLSTIDVNIVIPAKDMEILRRGHIPEAQEDHWFMYCDDEYIRYYRSWTGTCVFEARYRVRPDSDYRIDHITINKELVEFGVNGDSSSFALFCYLITAETGGDTEEAWENYLNTWEATAIDTAKVASAARLNIFK